MNIAFIEFIIKSKLWWPVENIGIWREKKTFKWLYTTRKPFFLAPHWSLAILLWGTDMSRFVLSNIARGNLSLASGVQWIITLIKRNKRSLNISCFIFSIWQIYVTHTYAYASSYFFSFYKISFFFSLSLSPFLLSLLTFNKKQSL